MATTTTNYGFDVPTSSDLVKNGATAIATLGQDIDTFLYRPFSKNVIINGGFDLAQRGTSFVVASKAYTLDRWEIWSTGAGGNCVVTRVAGTAGAQYAAEFGRQSGSTSLTLPQFAQTIETANATQYAGKNIVVSFEALKGANYSGGNLTVSVITGTGTDQNFTAFTGAATVSTNFTLTTSNAAYSTAAIAVPVGTTEIAVVFSYTATGTAGAADYVRLQKVQLEGGSQATPFSRAGGTIQGELAACQYYYQEIGGVSGTYLTTGTCYSTGGSILPLTFPIMRIAPSASVSAASDFASLNATGSSYTNASVSFATLSRTTASVTATVSSGFTAATPTIWTCGNANAKIKLSAEL